MLPAVGHHAGCCIHYTDTGSSAPCTGRWLRCCMASGPGTTGGAHLPCSDRPPGCGIAPDHAALCRAGAAATAWFARRIVRSSTPGHYPGAVLTPPAVHAPVHLVALPWAPTAPWRLPAVAGACRRHGAGIRAARGRSNFILPLPEGVRHPCWTSTRNPLRPFACAAFWNAWSLTQRPTPEMVQQKPAAMVRPGTDFVESLRQRPA